MYKEFIYLIVLVSSHLDQVIGGRVTKRQTSDCVLPPSPNNGVYVTNIFNGKPGDVSEYIIVNVTCNQNYRIDGLPSVYCYKGWWPDPMPKCVESSPSAVALPQTALVVNDDNYNSNCILPPYPEHGTYITNIANAKPGDIQEYLTINVTCDQDYRLEGSATIVCFNGWWPDKMPQCSSLTLSIAPTVDDPVDKPETGNKCILPQHAAHTTYTSNISGAKPGEAHDIVALNFTCEEGYLLNGPDLVFCINGQWQANIPRCVLRCRVFQHPSVVYLCQGTVELTNGEGFRACNDYEPSGTWAKPFCKPHYRATTALAFMECIDGTWTRDLQKCISDCGTLNPQGTQLIINGTISKYGDVPWHAAIYRKTASSVELICGGSLISTVIVISAAHCFWKGDLLAMQLPATNFVVAVGKLYSEYDNKMEQAQWSNVEALRIPSHYKHSSTNFQGDIAIVELSVAIEYQRHIRPICVDFDIAFEESQLITGKKGKVAGWGLTSENDARQSEILRVVDLPYVTVAKCFEHLPETFFQLITIDKFCAGYINEGTAVCRGDSGGGLAFPAMDKTVRRYYLRGIVSTAPPADGLCNSNTYTTFTRLSKYENFITRHWKD